MTKKQFYDWQTEGGGGEVSLLVETLTKNSIPWCMIGGLAVNHWALEPLVTADVDIVIATEKVNEAVAALEKVGFRAARFEWSINLKARSHLRVQISTEAAYQDFPRRSVSAEVHGIPMRVATLDDTLQGKILAWRDSQRRASKRQKDLLDIMRLVEAHSDLSDRLPADVAAKLRQAE